MYGRAYPQEAAYEGTEIPCQTVTPMQYTIKRGQEYALADAAVPTDYYFSWTYDFHADEVPDDDTVVRGQDRYYQIWFGHRFAFVRAADVRIVG